VTIAPATEIAIITQRSGVVSARFVEVAEANPVDAAMAEAAPPPRSARANALGPTAGRRAVA
jgi:hypothetical protein